VQVHPLNPLGYAYVQMSFSPLRELAVLDFMGHFAGRGRREGKGGKGTDLNL